MIKPKWPVIWYQQLRLSTSWARSGLCLTQLNSSQHHQVGEILTRNQPKQNFGSTRSGCISFRCVSVNFGFVDLAGFWLKSSHISLDLAGSNKIQLIFLSIYGDLAEILLDLLRFGQDHLILAELKFGLTRFLAKTHNF